MSEFFSPLYDNGLDTRSNSLITNDLLVKDPLTDEYKKVLPGGGGGGGGDVPYYIDDTEINFGLGKTKIDETKIELESSIQRYSMLDGFRARYYNNGAETDYEAGYIRWKDSEDEPVKKSILLSDLKEVQDKILPINYLNENSVDIVTNASFDMGLTIGSAGVPHKVRIRNAEMRIEGLNSTHRTRLTLSGVDIDDNAGKSTSYSVNQISHREATGAPVVIVPI